MGNRNLQYVRKHRLRVARGSGLAISNSFAGEHEFPWCIGRRELNVLDEGLPIQECEPTCYSIDPKFKPQPLPPLTGRELLALDPALQGARDWIKTSLGRDLESALCELSGRIEELASRGETAAKFLCSMSFGEHLGIDYARFHRIIETLEVAKVRGVAVSCRYHRIRGGEVSNRTLAPGERYVDCQPNAHATRIARTPIRRAPQRIGATGEHARRKWALGEKVAALMQHCLLIAGFNGAHRVHTLSLSKTEC